LFLKYKKMASKKYEYGLVLSGGGARGFAHIGAIKALHENGIRPEIISGVSAGAIVGAFYADGHEPEEILTFFSGTGLFRFFQMQLPKRGLFRISGLGKIMKKHLRSQTFEELKIPLYVTLCDLNHGESVFVNAGSLKKTVLASASIPGLVSPMLIDGITYVDGGVLNNLPIKPIKDQCESIIGIHVNHTSYVKDIQSIASIIERSFHLSTSRNIKMKSRECDIFIEPEKLSEFGIMDVGKYQTIYQIGYEKTMEVLANRS
jgi:NTE family protein